MKFVGIGAGAIGGYVGGHLAAAGHPVTFLARGATAAALRANGLTLTPQPAGAPRKVPIAVETELAAALASEPDCLIVATKTFDTQSIIDQLGAVTASPPPMLCLQNGVDGETQLAAAFGAERVVAGTVTTPVSVPAPGHAVVEKVRGIGLARGHPLSEPLAETLTAAGIPTQTYPSADGMKWSKLITNLLGNATAAITALPVAAIFADPRLYALEAASIRECLAVMSAYRYPVVNLPKVPVRLLTLAITRLPSAVARPILARAIGGGRGGKLPSLALDLQAGRSRTEVGWLHGAVARHAARLSVSAPINSILSETVDGLAAGLLEQERFRGGGRLLQLVEQRAGRKTNDEGRIA
jgi:2-dehydropantoate 2-reductase